MEWRRQAVQITPHPSAPLFKLQKLILEILLAWQKRPLFPIYHISYTAHWKASSASVMAWHIYEKCSEELGRYAQVQHFESHCALNGDSLKGKS